MSDPPRLGQVVRDALFLASSRTYAEQYIEPALRAHYGLGTPDGDDHDAIGPDGTRYEIKAGRVMRATGNDKNSKTLLDRIVFELENTPLNRLVPFSQATTAEYQVGIQNVKRDHFEILIYAVLFEDCVKVFATPSTEISTGKFKNWSDKHGRYDAVGKSGQFAVTKTTIPWHLKNTLRETLTYETMARIFAHLSQEDSPKE